MVDLWGAKKRTNTIIWVKNLLEIEKINNWEMRRRLMNWNGKMENKLTVKIRYS